MLKITVLGCGTSVGVPVPGCPCEVCTSDNPRNNRLRASIFIEDSSETTTSKFLIDTSTDLRQQSLRSGITGTDAVLYTHTHADHTFGIDDLRSFIFLSRKPIPVYASAEDADELERVFRYAFFPNSNYQGGAPPKLEMMRFKHFAPLMIAGTKILPLPVKHGRTNVTAYRIGNFAYATDCSEIPERTMKELKGLDTLVLDGLRKRPHNTHFTLEQAVRVIEQLKPRKSYLTHLSHEVEYQEGNKYLKSLTDMDVQLAYDGLEIVLR